MSSSLSDQCLLCARYRSGGACAAFPLAIPSEILTGEHDHREPFAGDHGLRFLARSGNAEKNQRAAFPELYD